jgi:NDP-sugar pyrophosphorylase family protein
MKVVIPMAGDGARFKEAGYDKPKPLIDVFGKPMYERVIDNLCANDSEVVLITRQEHDIDSQVKVSEKTEGAACTVLLARDYIDGDFPILIANCDQLLRWDVNHFLYVCESQNLDACVVTFNSTNPHHSYVRTKGGEVVEVAEKKVISDKAVAGIYWFKRGCDFVDYAAQMIDKDIRYNGEFYISPVLNELIQDGKKLGIYEIGVEDKVMLGTPCELQIFVDKVEDGALCLDEF